MSQSRTRLLHRPGGLLRKMRGDMTQAAERAMVRSGIVPSPLRIVLDVTDRCNFRCPTCSKWRVHPSRPELRLQDWEQVLPRIGAVPLLREAAVCGGEPFARTDIFDILRDNPRQLWRSEQARMIRGLSRRCTRLCRMLNNNLQPARRGLGPAKENEGGRRSWCEDMLLQQRTVRNHQLALPW